MIYYKIKIAKSGFCAPSGCIMSRAFQVGEYMWCEFDRVGEVATGWENVTAEDFEANKPAPAPDPAPSTTPDEDRDAMLIDLEYRMTLMELGV